MMNMFLLSVWMGVSIAIHYEAHYFIKFTLSITKILLFTIKKNKQKKKNISGDLQINSFYPTALKGCRGIVFTHGVRLVGRVAGKSLARMSETVMCRKQAWGQVHGAKYKYNYFAKLQVQVQVLISRVKYKYKYFEKLQVQVQVLLKRTTPKL